MNPIIALYSTVSELTGQMLLAARAGDWDRLSSLETDCAYQVQSLKTMETTETMNAAERQQKMRMVNQILANDRAIRTITEPWIDHLSQLLNSHGTQRKLKQSYGSNPAGFSPG